MYWIMNIINLKIQDIGEWLYTYEYEYEEL